MVTDFYVRKSQTLMAKQVTHGTIRRCLSGFALMCSPESDWWWVRSYFTDGSLKVIRQDQEWLLTLHDKPVPIDAWLVKDYTGRLFWVSEKRFRKMFVYVGSVHD